MRCPRSQEHEHWLTHTLHLFDNSATISPLPPDLTSFRCKVACGLGDAPSWCPLVWHASKALLISNVFMALSGAGFAAA